MGITNTKNEKNIKEFNKVILEEYTEIIRINNYLKINDFNKPKEGKQKNITISYNKQKLNQFYNEREEEYEEFQIHIKGKN